jgi:hypothetical protein
MDSTNAVVGTVTNQAVTTPLQATGTCDILNLTLGPLDLNLLGLRVQLLGNLLCAAAGLLDSPTGGGGGWHRQSAPVDRRVAEPDPRPARRLTDHGSAGAAPAPPRHYAATLLTLVGSGGILEREPFAVPGTAAGPTRTVAKRWSQGHDADAPIWTP